MSSEAKIAANRRNALASTGPTSAQGKAKARWNAFKHGGYAHVTLLGERAAEFKESLDDFQEHFKPEGPFESMCVFYIARSVWIMHRLTLAERWHIDGLVTHNAKSAASLEEATISAMAVYVTFGTEIGSFERARAHHRREMDYYIEKLQTSQEMRRKTPKE